jgi:hypothetical protein
MYQMILIGDSRNRLCFAEALGKENNLRSNYFHLYHFSISMASKYNFQQNNGNGNISDDFYLAIRGIGYVLLRL